MFAYKINVATLSDVIGSTLQPEQDATYYSIVDNADVFNISFYVLPCVSCSSISSANLELDGIRLCQECRGLSYWWFCFW